MRRSAATWWGSKPPPWRYFGREPATLSWAEAATLAVLPNNPSLVHLARNRERLQAKRDFAAAAAARGRRSRRRSISTWR